MTKKSERAKAIRDAAAIEELFERFGIGKMDDVKVTLDGDESQVTWTSDTGVTVRLSFGAFRSAEVQTTTRWV